MTVGGQDRPDVISTPPTERHRPLQCDEQRLGAVRGTQGEDLGDLGAQLGHPRCRGTGQELLSDRTQREGLTLDGGATARRPVRTGRPWPVVVGIVDTDLAWRDQRVFGVDLPGDRLDHS